MFGMEGYAQEEGDGGEIGVIDVEPETKAEKTNKNLLISSLAISRRRYAPSALRRPGYYYGLDITFNTIYQDLRVNVTNELLKNLFFIPTPILSFDIANYTRQHSFKFLYWSYSPISEVLLNYLLLQYSYDRPVKSNSYFLMGYTISYGSARMERNFDLEIGPSAMIFKSNFFGAQVNASYDTKRNYVVPQLGVGYQNISSTLDVDTTEEHFEYSKTLIYYIVGLSFSNLDRTFYVAPEIHFDNSIGTTITLTTSWRKKYMRRGS